MSMEHVLHKLQHSSATADQLSSDLPQKTWFTVLYGQKLISSAGRFYVLFSDPITQ